MRLIRWTRRGNIEPDYSAEIAEKFLIGFDKNDYDYISIYLSEEFKNFIKQFKVPETADKTYSTASEAFSVMTALKDKNNNILKDVAGNFIHMKDKIGYYQEGTLKFIRFLAIKDYSCVIFYKAKYSNEPNGDVKIRIGYKNEYGKMLISGFWFSSKTLVK